MTIQIRELRGLRDRLGKLAAELADERNKLRELLSDVESLLETADEGYASLERARHELNEALDELGRLV